MSNVPNTFMPPNAQPTGLVTTTYELEVAEKDRGDMWADPAAFAHWHRVAFTFAHSMLVPAHLRGEDKVASILVALDMARRLRMNPLQVLQSLYDVSGNAGWKATFLSALATNDGWDVDYEIVTLDPPILDFQHSDGKARMENLSVVCIMEKGGKVRRGPKVTSAMAVAAKWATKGDKYTTITEVMLGYRAITFAVRRWAPGLLLGLPTSLELEDEREERNAAVDPATYTDPEAAPKKPSRGMAAVAAAVSPAPSTAGETPGQTSSGAGSPVTSSSTPATEGAYTPPTEPSKTKAPAINSVAEADMIAAGLVTQPRGHRVSFELAKRALREKLQVTKLGDERVFSALRYGAGVGKWDLIGGEHADATFLVFPKEKVPHQVDVDPDSVSAEEELGPSVAKDMAIRTALNGDAECWDRERLEQLIADEELAIGEDERFAAGAEQIVKRIAMDAGIQVTDVAVVLDNATAGQLRAMLAAMRTLRRQ